MGYRKLAEQRISEVDMTRMGLQRDPKNKPNICIFVRLTNGDEKQRNTN